MATEVICAGDSYSLSGAGDAIGSFANPTGTVSVADDKLSVDGNGAALETDIDSTLTGATFTGTGTDSSVGTATYDSITDITLSTVLSKDGTFVVLKATISFDVKIGATWILPNTNPSTKYTTGTKLGCTLSWTTTQTKLRA